MNLAKWVLGSVLVPLLIQLFGTRGWVMPLLLVVALISVVRDGHLRWERLGSTRWAGALALSALALLAALLLLVLSGDWPKSFVAAQVVCAWGIAFLLSWQSLRQQLSLTDAMNGVSCLLLSVVAFHSALASNHEAYSGVRVAYGLASAALALVAVGFLSGFRHLAPYGAMGLGLSLATLGMGLTSQIDGWAAVGVSVTGLLVVFAGWALVKRLAWVVAVALLLVECAMFCALIVFAGHMRAPLSYAALTAAVFGLVAGVLWFASYLRESPVLAAMALVVGGLAVAVSGLVIAILGLQVNVLVLGIGMALAGSGAVTSGSVSLLPATDVSSLERLAKWWTKSRHRDTGEGVGVRTIDLTEAPHPADCKCR